MSPNYPDPYFNDASCFWLLHSTQNQVALELADFSLETNFDYLTIYDGQDSTSVILARLTGAASLDIYFSSGKDMYITFTSDVGVTDKGFELRYASRIYILSYLV